MSNHVTICRVSRRGLLCLACLSAFEVIAQYPVVVENFPSSYSVYVENFPFVQKVEPDNGVRWTVRIDEQTDFANDVSNCARLSEFILKSLNYDFRNYSNPGTQFSSYFIGVGSDSDILHRKNMGQLGYMDSINNQLIQTSIIEGGSAYTTLFGLIAGWAPNSVPNIDGIPYGVEDNGIWAFEKKQVSLQETLTNQLERLISQQSIFFTNVNYQLSPLLINSPTEDFNYNSWEEFVHDGLFPTDGSENTGFLYNLGAGLVFPQIFKVPTTLYSSESYQFLASLNLASPDSFWDTVGKDFYTAYGTKWGFDSITNILLSQNFDFTSIDAVKPDVDDLIQDSTQDVQESLPSNSEELENVPPGDYEEIQDERIDTAFLDEAKTDATSIKFSEHLFDDFKNSYNGIFNFSSSSSLQYSFALQFSDGENVSVNDTDMLGNFSQLLSDKKPTIDALIKIIIGLNKFICLVVLVGKAFKMVSEIFSS